MEKRSRREFLWLALGLGSIAAESCASRKVKNSVTSEPAAEPTPDPQDIDSAIRGLNNQFLPENFQDIKDWEKMQNAPPLNLCLEWPVYGPISSYFKVIHPQGIDIDKYRNSKDRVKAPLDGTVVFAGGDPKVSLGNFVVLQHENGIFTLYGHLRKIETEVNKKIKTGDEIGIIGQTGYATGPHLHFELRALKNIDQFSALSPYLKYSDLWEDGENNQKFYFYNPLNYLNSQPLGGECKPVDPPV